MPDIQATTLEEAYQWHERGKATSPRAMSVRHTEAFIQEIERLKKEIRQNGYMPYIETDFPNIDVGE